MDYFGLIKEKSITRSMTKTEKFFKRLPFTTFFDTEFIGNKLDKKLIEKVKNCDLEGIKNYIKMGADVNARDENNRTCLMLACEKSNFDVVDLILNEGVKLDLRDKFGRTALHYACAQRNLRIVSSILNRDVGKRKFRKRINRKDNDGNTPLILAVQNNHYYTVNHLLLNGAIKSIKNKEGKDAFSFAKNNDNVKLMILIRTF